MPSSWIKKKKGFELTTAARCREVMFIFRYDKRQSLTQETTNLKVNTLPNTEEPEWQTSWSEHKDCNE